MLRLRVALTTKRKPIAVLLVLIIGLSIFLYFQSNSDNFKGEVEGTVLSHTAEVSGKLIETPIQLGQTVKRGDIIAVIDNESSAYALEQLKLKLEKAQLSLSSVQVGMKGSADNNLTAANANYSSAQTALTQAEDDYKNARTLYGEAAISKETLENAKAKYQTAAAAAKAAKSAVSNATDQSASKSAQVDIALLESQIAQQESLQEKHTITAQCDGTIISKNYSAGDMVTAGYNIADISSSQERYLTIYYPKDRLNEVVYDQKVNILWGSKTFIGTVKFIDVSSAYTPKELQTAANKNMKSVKIKILLPEDCPVNPGQRAEAVF